MLEIFSPDVNKKIKNNQKVYDLLSKEVLDKSKKILNFDVLDTSNEKYQEGEIKVVVSSGKLSKDREKFESEIGKFKSQAKELEEEGKLGQAYDLKGHIKNLEFYLSKISKWTGDIVEYTIKKDGETIEPSKLASFGGEFDQLQ